MQVAELHLRVLALFPVVDVGGGQAHAKGEPRVLGGVVGEVAVEPRLGLGDGLQVGRGDVHVAVRELVRRVTSCRGTAVLPTTVCAAETTRIGSTASSASSDGGQVGPVNSPPVRSQSARTLLTRKSGLLAG